MKHEREQYEYMKELDDFCRAESAQFPKLQSQLEKTIANLTNELENLTEQREEQLQELKKQSEFLSAKIWKIRQETKTCQIVDNLQIKRLSVTSNKVIKVRKSASIKTLNQTCLKHANFKELGRITEKSASLLSLSKTCLELERSAQIAKNFPEDETEIDAMSDVSILKIIYSNAFLNTNFHADRKVS